MNNIDFKADDAVNIITQALDDFLKNKSLKLTTQQYDKLKKLLMVRLLEEDMSYSNAYNSLCEIVEYRKDYEIDANAPDEAEEEMIRIIGAADVREIEVIVETAKFKKRFIIVASLLFLILIGITASKTVQYFKDETMVNVKMATVITTSEEAELKTLVLRIVELEKLRGNNITHNAIYNEMKQLENIKSAGNATSYKKFNRAQFSEATIFLNKWIQQISSKEAL